MPWHIRKELNLKQLFKIANDVDIDKGTTLEQLATLQTIPPGQTAVCYVSGQKQSNR